MGGWIKRWFLSQRWVANTYRNYWSENLWRSTHFSQLMISHWPLDRLSSQVTDHIPRRELVLRTILVHKFSPTYCTLLYRQFCETNTKHQTQTTINHDGQANSPASAALAEPLHHLPGHVVALSKEQHLGWRLMAPLGTRWPGSRSKEPAGLQDAAHHLQSIAKMCLKYSFVWSHYTAWRPPRACSGSIKRVLRWLIIINRLRRLARGAM